MAWAVRTFFVMLSLGAAAQTPLPSGVPVPVQPWQVQTLTTRALEGGQSATLALAIRTPVSNSTRHVLLFLSPYMVPMLKVAQGPTAVALNAPWVMASAHFNAQGIAVAFADAPSDANKRSLAHRASSEIAADIRAAVQSLSQQFPGIPIHLAGFGVGAGSLLEATSGLKEVSRVVIVSGDFSDHRTDDWSSYKRPVLLIHAPSAQCDYAPFIEAESVARKNRFSLMRVGYSQSEAKPNCGRASQHILSGLETELSTTVAHWLDGAEPPATLGYSTPQIAWREQVVGYTAPSTFGSNRLEMTLLFPSGAGPHPVVMFNHGDIEIDSAFMRYKRRFVDRVVAREFLQLGWAVVFPSRAGVGLSEGNYRKFDAVDGDPTYKARVQAQDILPVFEYLKTNSEIDATRIIVTGQSAGGYAAMHLASLNLSGVVGAVDFSGGRTDKLRSSSAGFLNAMMVDGFAEFGKTTKVPTLWVFAENDTRYTPNTIRASHKAFVEAGGKATLSLSPPIDGDGHYVHKKPDLWRQALRDYMAGLTGVALAQ